MDRLAGVLSKPPQRETRRAPSGAPAEIAGRWDVELQFRLGSTRHTLFLEQKSEELRGTHIGEVTTGSARGRIEGTEVDVSTRHPYEGTSLGYRFRGTVAGDTMSGTVDLGEYGEARWSAKRHSYDTGERRRSG